MMRGAIWLMAVGISTAAVADSPWLYGIHWYGSTQSTLVEEMTSGKGIWTLETVIGRDTSQVEKFRTIVERGHTIVARIQINWGYSAPRPEDLDRYLDDVEFVARAYADTVHIWQVGNEPNILDEFGGEELSPEYSVESYVKIRERIHRVTSALGPQIVLVPPVSPGPIIPGIRWMHGSDYLRTMCETLTPETTDGFNIHSYGDPSMDAQASRAVFRQTYAEQLEIIDEHGFEEFPVYMGEWNRRVHPLTAEQEAESAKFLWGAFQDLAEWNATPGNHPIVSACWFVYAIEPQWNSYSIEYLRSVHPPGRDNDLFDAFQYACQQDFPAGYDFPERRTPSPTPTQTPQPPGGSMTTY